MRFAFEKGAVCFTKKNASKINSEAFN